MARYLRPSLVGYAERLSSRAERVADELDEPLARQIERWERLIGQDAPCSWALFAPDTLVVLPAGSEGDVAIEASSVLRRYGPVVAGTPRGDFSVIHVPSGWVVASGEAEILTWVSPIEVDINPATRSRRADVRVGLTGRSKRGEAARREQLLHSHVASPTE